MSERNTLPDHHEQENTDLDLQHKVTGPWLYRFVSLFLAFCILSIVIFQLPLSDTNKILACAGIFLLDLFLLVLTAPKRTTTQQFIPQEIHTMQPTDDTTSLEEETEIAPVEAEPLSDFEQLVQEALHSIPSEFLPYMENLAVIVEDEPDSEALQRAGVPPGYTLLGLYYGSPLTDYGHRYSGLPEHITIYQGPIERRCHGDPERIRMQVRATVLHEVAHHFGINHDDMPHWVK